MSVINTNITAMIGQQNLGRSQSALQTSMERLSSGLRINSAKDDAAGQAIANRMSAQITGLSQAQRNANDGISVAQTAEGALNQINDNVQRIRELTVQSQNGTNSTDDLRSIQDEITQRLAEIDRISAETSFNGVDVLAQDQKLSIQVGANDGQTIEVGLQKINSQTLSLGTFNVTGPTGTPAAWAAGDTAVERHFGDTTEISSVSLSNTTTTNFATDLQTRLGVSAGITLDGSVQADDNGNLFAKVTIDGAALTETDVENLKARGIDIDTDSATNDFYIALDPSEGEIEAADGTASTTNLNFELDADSIDLKAMSQGSTTDPLATLDSALNKVDSLRSELGAVQNRFESAITNLSTNTTNLSAARSRIEDADYAVEVSNMTRAQILQQAGTSVLAQANQVPQSVLSLLG
ncbi:FliC/FljB family flagellin [Alloalcanivorax xenomutans]|uniref:FliC/FljB family flagellin n=1 Tax=Alloalcanivorax xenomutans TaxID=1094342 RepID=UPI001F2F44B4|nr:FliC/FljB family flagellin [Alloalcanivorax xenomutans]MCE7522637.1 FliC/FljB family flagellin [Alloalcanivorax xenomutans]